jgi:hypothetical protein
MLPALADGAELASRSGACGQRARWTDPAPGGDGLWVQEATGHLLGRAHPAGRNLRSQAVGAVGVGFPGGVTWGLNLTPVPPLVIDADLLDEVAHDLGKGEPPGGNVRAADPGAWIPSTSPR